LQSLTRALLHPKSKIKIDANALDFFPVICRTRSNDPVETQGEVKDTLILSRAFGPNGRSGTFALRLTEADTKLDEEDLEQVQNCIQSAFFKLVTNQMKMEKTINLTPREKEIVKWITRGKSNPDIAQIIGISIHTVNGYLRGIYLKTQTGDRVSLSFFALHHGLIA
jgi:LuxR family transcriptional regulator/LuxR family quorum-sensing system transcriptional regulator CciR